MSCQKYVCIVACLYLCTVLHTVQTDEACDKTKCPGPLAYYDALNCTPIYEAQGDCCAIKYNCSKVDNRSKDKCYVNEKEYDLGEALRDEDANPCDIGCTCRTGYDGVASFNCATVDCFQGPTNSGCYRKNSPLACCPGNEVCPENPEDRATCNVNGKEYRDGEFFQVESDPDLLCVCQPGYEGKNVEPFCARPKHPYCSPDFRSAGDLHAKCAPVYYASQKLATSCSVFSRCQNSNDTVVNGDSESDSDLRCTFGNLTMNLKDELNQATDYSSVCVKCVCEVPPTPTCQRLSDEECDVTDHPSFDTFE